MLFWTLLFVYLSKRSVGGDEDGGGGGGGGRGGNGEGGRVNTKQIYKVYLVFLFNNYRSEMIRFVLILSWASVC